MKIKLRNHSENRTKLPGNEKQKRKDKKKKTRDSVQRSYSEQLNVLEKEKCGEKTIKEITQEDFLDFKYSDFQS